MRVHLVDGTFELFRCFHGAPRACGADGGEVGAVRGLIATLGALLGDPEVTHMAVAFDSVVAPPRTSGGGAEQLIARQAPLAAECVRALGVPVWPSSRYQADEIISTAAHRFGGDPSVDQVVICATDNDFTQCVRGTKVVLLDRIRRRVTDEDGVRARFGVRPDQIPELFALVGDRSDGLPGIPGWGARSAAAVLTRYETLEAIPDDPAEWDVVVRGKASLGANLRARWDEAVLCRDLSVLRTDLPLQATLDQLKWRGAHRDLVKQFCVAVDDHTALDRLTMWRATDA